MKKFKNLFIVYVLKVNEIEDLTMAEQFFEEILKESMSDYNMHEVDYKKKIYEMAQVSLKIYVNIFVGLCVERNLWQFFKYLWIIFWEILNEKCILVKSIL